MPRAKKQNEVQKVNELPQAVQDQQFSDDLRRKASKMRSELPTPKKHWKRKSGGTGGSYDYVEEAVMRSSLDEHFPTWSWIPAGTKPVEFLGSEWVFVCGSLVIDDHGEKRTFFSPGAQRVMFKSGQPHTPENVIDIDKNLRAANSNALKGAINRLTRLHDDVYHKVDLSLTEEQIESFKDLLKHADGGMVQQIKIMINNGEINKSNFDVHYNNIYNEINNKETK